MNARSATPALWTGMLELYAAPGVADACIDMQDRHDADVLLLLTAALLSGAGIPLPPEPARRLVAETQEWRTEVVIPLRALRRRWRGIPAAASLREQVRALELEAERSQVRMLQALLDEACLPASGLAGVDLLHANCMRLVPGLARTPAGVDALARFCSRLSAVLAEKPRGS